MKTGKWENLVATPRPLTKELEEVHGKPFFFLRGAVRRWEQVMAHAPVVLVCVVQANEALYDASTSTWAPAVLLYSTDPRRAMDGPWLQELADKVRALRQTRTGDPAVDALGDLLNDEDSSFSTDLPAALTGGAHARMHVTYLAPDRLPGRAVPANGLLLGLGGPDEARLLPPSYYS